MEKDRAINLGRYNYYQYYDMKKHIYRLNYEEKKQREKETKKDENYYHDYWKNCLWKKD